MVLRFPKAEETIDGTNLIRAEKYRLRPEFGEIHDIGLPLDEKQAQIAEILSDYQLADIPVCVSYGSGVGFLQQGYTYGKQWEWMADFRTYRIDELSTVLVPEEATEDDGEPLIVAV